jgi:hypothetical protein
MAAYAHIRNLYKDTDILLFRECYALEKLHGESANIAWNMMDGDRGGEFKLDPGGVSPVRFAGLFEAETLRQRLVDLGQPEATVYGEVYGGSTQHMSYLYGKDLRFIVFDVLIGGVFLNVPNAEDVAKKLGLEFVAYERIPATLEAIDAQRDADSVQAVRNGIGPGHKREGVVLRPLIELRKNNDERIICKHKNDKFIETATPREVNPEQLKVLAEADAIATEWVTAMRLAHVLSKLPDATTLQATGAVMKAMVEDVVREAAGEIVDSKDARKAIAKRAAELFKAHVGGGA